MKIRFPLLLALLLGVQITFAQQLLRPALTSTPLSAVEQLKMPLQDNKTLREAELRRQAPGIAPKFAEPISVQISPQNQGSWERLPSGDWVWRVRIFSKNAYSLNLGFTQYQLPPQSRLLLYSPDLKTIQGPFTPADNESHNQLWTPILQGEEVVVELQVPAAYRAKVKLEIGFVNHDFVDFLSTNSQSCNLDVICGAEDGWGEVDDFRDIIRSVAVISINGIFQCSGFLVNNARQDCTPYFMTADHCGVRTSSAPTVVAYWNYENSECREPGSPESGAAGDGDLSDFNTGAEFVAAYSGSDFTLVKLDDPVSPTANAFFAGWDNSDKVPQRSVCVHHPNTDEKRISFENDPCYIANEISNAAPNSNGQIVIVPDWDVGTTEGGSSGAPLFNEQKQVVGQLFGGFASCNNDDFDGYGWMHSSWEGDGTPQGRLKDWLDPDGIGLKSLDGRNQSNCGRFLIVDEPVQTTCASGSVSYLLETGNAFTDTVLLSLAGLPEGIMASFSQNPVPPASSTTLTISDLSGIPPDAYLFNVTYLADSILVQKAPLRMNVFSENAPVVQLESPMDSLQAQSDQLSFSWEAQVPGTVYDLQIALDAAFQDIIVNALNLTTTTYVGPQLEPTTDYFWRVRATTPCQAGDWSEVFTFSTSKCQSFFAEDLPLTIPPDEVESYNSFLTIPFEGAITDLDVVNLQGRHTWISDLTFQLTSPSGQTITLFDQICFNENDFNLNLDDEAPATPLPCPPVDGVRGQPQQPLSTFIGESPNGTWQLTLTDNFEQDGGTLQNWGLKVCTTDFFSLKVLGTEETVLSCSGEDVSFQLNIGEEFDTTAINLQIQGLPEGALASFSQNPARAGDTVLVSITGLTEVEGAVYPLLLFADDGENSGSTDVDLQVSTVPIAPVTRTPLDGGNDVPIDVNFNWNDVPNATSYWLEIALDSAFTQIVERLGVVSNTYTTTLDYGTTYFWRVIARNSCGETPAPPSSFTTLLDLAVTTTPTVQQLCPGSEALFKIALGGSFDSAGVDFRLEPFPQGALVSYSANPALPGSEVELRITNFQNVASGIYNLSLIAEDGTFTATTDLMLIVEKPPVQPALLTPEDGAEQVSQQPTFVWEGSNRPLEYVLQLAADEAFTEVFFTQRTFDTTFTLLQPLMRDVSYFWRVQAENSCGRDTSVVGTFFTGIISSVENLKEDDFRLYPNPAEQEVWLEFEQVIGAQVQGALFTVDGRQLRDFQVPAFAKTYRLPLDRYPSGVYILQFSTSQHIISKRLVIQR